MGMPTISTGLCDHQELEHDGCDAAEVSGTACAFQALGEALDPDEGVEACGIDFVGRGDEHSVSALRLEELEVAGFIARVAGEILIWAELRGVHEDGRGRLVVVLDGRAHERKVPFVEVAHRGDEAERAVELAAPGAKLCDRAKD
jgi:hypothetical protein